ncbi:MAG: type I-MYXAN CRISPR-associated endonuclease Cas1 [Pyrinomonadaceae bacterium MAG19_C2-C3]|nr:type I-MYXAN CRISPR-associated endonuclease Cas1 [Pyrinomonadaceae bacterium MAG19_C2-C3]
MSDSLPIHALHALRYCERLFYLENVEQLRVADAAVFAGRRLHVEIERDEDEGEELTLVLESERLGLKGRVDCIRRRDGQLVPYEHKRGRAARDGEGKPEAWASDRLQIIAYAVLVEEHAGREVVEGRVRYHADKVTVRVGITEAAREELRVAIARAGELGRSVERPPVTENERLCPRCSLAPVCLPEEARLAGRLRVEDVSLVAPKVSGDGGVEAENGVRSQSASSAATRQTPLRLFPADDERRTLHVLTQGARVGRKGDRFEIAVRDEESQLHPVREVGQIVLHGFSQITTQALRLCSEQDIGVHWVTTGGRYIGGLASGAGSVQRRIRQYRALTDDGFCLKLAGRLAEARARGQLSFLLRASRDAGRAKAAVKEAVGGIRKLLAPLSRATNIDSLRGYEGSIGAHYFSAMPDLIVPEAGEAMRPDGRNRRPPKDRCNALLSYGYTLLQKDVTNAIITTGLDPCLGFYHQPRSQAPPLALDLMELFRVSMVDLPVVASINRKQWDESEDFDIAGEQVWLSDTGRKKFIGIYERRKTEKWKHPVINYSLSYSRLIELEVRLLEKEWTSDEGGLFARMRMR